MKPSEVLAKAADLIEPEGAWRQGYYARDGAGRDCDAHDPSAICWCAVGSIERSVPICNYDDLDEAERFLTRALGGAYVPHWNDAKGRTQAEVVSALRKASELAKAEGQ
jgi:hypothetical protein